MSAEAKAKFEKEYGHIFSPYLDKEKMEARIISYEYLVGELEKIEKETSEKDFVKILSKKELIINSKIKDLCRKGVPLKGYKELVLKVLRIDFSKNQYETHFKRVFKGRSLEKLGTFIPLFSNKNTLEEMLPVHFLNADGIQVLKEILWLINAYLPTIDYCPLIVKLTSWLLIFFNKEETYEIMRTLITRNIDPPEINLIRWHFRYDFSENMKIGNSILDSINNLADADTKFKLSSMETFGLQREKFIQTVCESFFLDYFNFYGILRFFPFFLIEGTKSIYRLTHAMLKYTPFEITKTLSEEEIFSTFKNNSSVVKEIDDLFNFSYKIDLTRKNNQYANQVSRADERQKMRNFYYLSSFSPESKILTDDEIVQIWSKLPSEAKVYDAKLLYDTKSSPEADLSTLYDICNGYNEDNFILFIIQTENDEVFGGITSKNIINDGKLEYDVPKQAILFSARPNVGVYDYDKEQKEVLLYEPGAIRFGYGDDGPAITVAHDLKEGWTEKKTVFGDVNLLKEGAADGSFKIKNMEVYLLV
ncbi:MAG: TLD domain-containing protein [archaeon]|nr:TLD domain-containing protein [archaeon]